MRKIWYKGEDGKWHNNFENLPPGTYCMYKENRNGKRIPVMRNKRLSKG